MFNNSTKALFFSTLIGGMLITISSNSWLSAWMGLEINLLSFIPIMSNYNNVLTMEASLSYFLVQALTSSTLLFIILSKSMMDSMFSIMSNPITNFMVVTPLLMKSGAAPLHWWLPNVMEGLSWSNCLLMLTMQKIAPLMLISYLTNFNLPMFIIIILSILVGTIGGYNQTSLRKILTYSSINHLGWMFSAMIMGESLWILYFLIYSLLTFSIISIIVPLKISFINQAFLMEKYSKTMKLLLFSSLLSLGGLPPFIGFLPKWIIIQFMIQNSFMLISSTMVVMSLITLYYYLRISYSSFIFLSSEGNWTILSPDNSLLFMLSISLSSISMMGLAGCTMFINLFM